MKSLVERFKTRDRRALARAITLLENGVLPEGSASELIRGAGKAYRIGITGPPGAGKSTLLDRLAARIKDRGQNPAIIAVDPTSPFTGGAILGDRYRMEESQKRGIFIRSLATRGSLGGLSRATTRVADLLDVFGFDPILIETVGVGQAELDIMAASDTVIVVLVPESGDALQAMKAGLMEIADIFVINKADRPGADLFERELQSVLNLSDGREGWRPPVLKTVALTGQGVEAVLEAVDRHHRHLESVGLLKVKRRHRIRLEIEEALRDLLWESFTRRIHWQEVVEKAVDAVLRGEKTAFGVAKEVHEKHSAHRS